MQIGVPASIPVVTPVVTPTSLPLLPLSSQRPHFSKGGTEKKNSITEIATELTTYTSLELGFVAGAQ